MDEKSKRCSMHVKEKNSGQYVTEQMLCQSEKTNVKNTSNRKKNKVQGNG